MLLLCCLFKFLLSLFWKRHQTPGPAIDLNCDFFLDGGQQQKKLKPFRSKYKELNWNSSTRMLLQTIELKFFINEFYTKFERFFLACFGCTLSVQRIVCSTPLIFFGSGWRMNSERLSGGLQSRATILFIIEYCCILCIYYIYEIFCKVNQMSAYMLLSSS